MTKKRIQSSNKTITIDESIYDYISLLATENKKTRVKIIEDIVAWYAKNDVRNDIPSITHYEAAKAIAVRREDADLISQHALDKGYKNIDYFRQIVLQYKKEND